MMLKDTALSAYEAKLIQQWRNGWGPAWKRSLRRLWLGGASSLDALYCNDLETLRGLREQIEPILDQLTVPYSGPDRD